jgi:hypothetical protein
VIAFSTFQDSEISRLKKKKRRYRFKNTGGAGHTILGFPRTSAGHPDSRFHASPRILENWTVSKNRLRPSRFQIPRLTADFGELGRFQDPVIAMQNPDYAPRPERREKTGGRERREKAEEKADRRKSGEY